MPPKSKGRGKSFGRGRGRESKQERRPGAERKKHTSQSTSEESSSFHQDPVQSLPSQTSQENKQTPETEKSSSAQKVPSSETTLPSKSSSSSIACGGDLKDVVRKSRDEKGEQQQTRTYQAQKMASNVREKKAERDTSQSQGVYIN